MLRMIPLALVAALTLAACASSSTSTPPAAGGTSAPPASSGSTVQVANSAQYGSILVDAQGNTLYLFDQDTGKTSACTGTCTSNWPALTVSGSPTAGTGVDASLLGTAKQADGSTQVTYNGHLLYTFTGDSAPGATSGEGVEDFFIISSTGDKVASAMAPSSSSSSAYHY
jgi:predicted lipoprotein with Yx(FWY)xxD motif